MEKVYVVTWYTKQNRQIHENVWHVTARNAAEARMRFEEAYYDSGMPPMKKPHPFGIQVRLEKRERSGKSDESGEKE